MPNYCLSKLVLKGPSGLLKDIAEHRLDFQHYVPAGNDCREAWGTRSSPLDLEITYTPEYDPNTLKAEFMTAWSPPTVFLQTLLRLFPSLWIKLEFEIEGGLGCGLCILQMKEGCVDEAYLGWQEPVFEYESETESEIRTD